MLGQTISHYRIVEKLGEGGMGVVYKAEDLKLGRAVALKFLPSHLIESQEHKARFLHEARAAALLDHPNICTVYEIDEADGRAFLAMACLEGQTLRQKIAARPLPLDEALDIATQIGQGLQAAHEKGVVHRDIKPANVMITPNGHVKIMDFGLAQLSDRTKLTASGIKLGTPAYMSPEQTEGKAIDRRSDIWSLGAVLYEMVSGRVPFPGELEAAVAHAILYGEPEPLTALRSGIPIELDRIVAKALAKSPAGRYQHVEELVVDVKTVHEHHKRSAPKANESRGRFAGDIGESATAGASVARPSARTAWIVALVSLGLAAALGILYLQQERPQAEAIAFTVDTGTQPRETFGGSPAVSPDGRAIAYVAQDDSGLDVLWVRRLDSNAGQPLQGTQDARRPFWSPDGRSLAFFAGGQLKKIDPSGGPAISIGEAAVGLGGAWSPNGEIVFAPGNRTPLHRVPAGGGVPSPITSLDSERGENSHRWPQFLPDGRRFLFTIRAADPENTMLAVGSLDSQPIRRLFRVQSNVRFAPGTGARDGYLLFARDRALIAQPFDAASLELRGEPAGLMQGLLHNVVSVFADFSVSDNGGVLVYRRGSGLNQLSWFDRNGKRLESIGGLGEQIQPRLSPDGKKLAISMPDPQTGNRDVWVMELSTGVPQRLTFVPSNDWQPTWSPDGTRILFSSDRKGGQGGLYQRLASGAGDDEGLLDNAGTATDWSLDGRFILFQRSLSGEQTDIRILPLNPPREPISFSQRGLYETDAHFSPDGRWIAYTSNESGRHEVYVRPFPKPASGVEFGSQGPRQVSTQGGAGARWRRDGRELYYLSPDHNLMAVEVKPGDRFEVSPPRALFVTCDPFFWTAYYESTYDAAADGQRFIFNCPVEKAAPVEVVVNWTANLKGSGAR
jgi:Tol biopolymer transport system component/tRNA A-37 threonylcarbamoyl transferase component Bud32